MNTSRRLALLGATTALLLSGTGIANADDIYNNLDPTIDAAAEVMPLNVGANGTTTLAVNNTGTDGKNGNGCNLTGQSTLTVSVVSSDTSVATVSPNSITFTSCGYTQVLTVHAVAEGSATISLTEVSNTTKGSFNLDPAKFTVNVTAPAPANTAPAVSVVGVTDGTSYNKGSVPAATCYVTDKEDGDSSFPATLSAITGDYAADGIGQQKASCSYTDRGGIYAASSVIYNIIDPTPPSISYTLDPQNPDGESGWYKSDVTLKWTVSESESPSSLVKTGCVDQTITADQLPIEYSCSASSAGGPATPVNVTIKRDGTAPSVNYTLDPATPNGTNGWYTTDVTAHFSATDATSGPATQSADVSSNGAEGQAVVLDSPVFTDNAGNSSKAGAATTTVKIDKTAPSVTVIGGPNDGASYYYGQVPAAPTCSAGDSLSGLAGDCSVTLDKGAVNADLNAVGDHTWTVTATDNAGNTTAKSISYTVLAWTDNGFYAPVNMGIPNTVKAGSTVPLKFNVFAGSTELTSTTVVKSFTVKGLSCSDLTGTSDAVEFTTTGGTSLRYDSTGRQFVQNWQTPAKSNTCWTVSMTTQDGTHLDANFKLK